MSIIYLLFWSFESNFEVLKVILKFIQNMYILFHKLCLIQSSNFYLLTNIIIIIYLAIFTKQFVRKLLTLHFLN